MKWRSCPCGYISDRILIRFYIPTPALFWSSSPDTFGAFSDFSFLTMSPCSATRSYSPTEEEEEEEEAEEEEGEEGTTEEEAEEAAVAIPGL